MNFTKSNQSEIWRKIKEKKERMRVHSTTDSVNHIYENYQKELEEYKKAFVFKPEYVTGFDWGKVS